VEFARVVSGTSAGADVLPLLAGAAVEEVGADAAAVVEIAEGGVAKIVAERNLPRGLEGWSVESDAVTELGDELLAACKKRFSRARTLPMMSAGGLYGALVLFYRTDTGPDAAMLTLAEGFVDLAAMALARDASDARHARSNAELRASREVLARTEKLRALGQMAAGVSHDLKNILNPLSLHLQLLKRICDKTGGPPEALSSIAEMRAAVQRGVETIDRLREFSRQTPEVKLEPIDPNPLVQEAIRLARARLASKAVSVELREELGSAPMVLARTGDLVSTIVNLVVNAIDALPKGGTITVATGDAGGGAWIRVTDDGPGMPPEVEKRVFEPFFSTKGEEGTGLGLAMVYAFVRRHGGSIRLATAPGRGASFTLSFPPIEPPASR
jgi:signal transduction histidine kinase